jgi:hypothetical protein
VPLLITPASICFALWSGSYGNGTLVGAATADFEQATKPLVPSTAAAR